MSDFELRLASLEARVAALEPKPVEPEPVHIGVCAMGFADSASCSQASLYRRREGCTGDACLDKATEYYRNYRETRRVAREVGLE